MTCINFVPDLYDLGGVHVCWDTNLQCPVQDPTVGGTNSYCGPGNIFQNAQGDTYYRVSIPDGAVYVLNQVTPASQQGTQAQGSQQQTSRPASPSLNNPQTGANLNSGPGANAPVHSPASGSTTLVRTTSSGSGSGTGAAVAGGLGGIGGALTQQVQVGQFNLPVWAWAGGGLLLVSTLQRMRRR